MLSLIRRRMVGGEWRRGVGLASQSWMTQANDDVGSHEMNTGTHDAAIVVRNSHTMRKVVPLVSLASPASLGWGLHSSCVNTGMMRDDDHIHGMSTIAHHADTSSSSVHQQEQLVVNSTVAASDGAPPRVPLYDLNKQPIVSDNGGAVHVELPEDIFSVPVRIDILHRVVRWQLAKRQQGTHVTKTRSDVRGGGRKPWQQKGSGRARQGTIRAPQWRGGGVVHGPVLRSHAHKLQKRVRRLGLACAVSAKVAEGRFIVVDSLEPENGKTATMKGHVERLLEGAPRESVLFVDTNPVDEVRLGTRNIPWVDVLPVEGMNVYSILRRDFLILSKDAVDAFVDRMRRPIKPCSPTP